MFLVFMNENFLDRSDHTSKVGTIGKATHDRTILSVVADADRPPIAERMVDRFLLRPEGTPHRAVNDNDEKFHNSFLSGWGRGPKPPPS